MNNNLHIPVLLSEVLRELDIKPNHKYIDCTLGAGGHSEAILKLGGKVLGIEADSTMLGISKERLKNYCPTLLQGNFSEVFEIASKCDFTNVSGILFDLGVSTFHYETLGRGFSINKLSEPLDMRLEPAKTNVTASDLLNMLPINKLVEMFEFVLDKRESRQVAKLIVDGRKQKRLSTVADIREILHKSLPEVFLALRMAVNDEIHAIEKGLFGAVKLLENSGKLAVISFHSGEDSLVLYLMKKLERDGIGQIVYKKPIFPSDTEIAMNSKSRSAILRIFKKNE